MKGQERKHVELHWLEGYKLDVDDDGFVQKEWKKKYDFVAQSSTKRYYNCLYLLCKLSPCARNLMDYLAEIMDSDNMISTTNADREKFMEFIVSITNNEVSYSDAAVKKALQELKKKNLLLSKNISRCKVNPLYFFNGSDKKRIELIKLTIKIGTGLGDNDFKWHSEEVLGEAKFAKHKAIAKKIMEAEINL